MATQNHFSKRSKSTAVDFNKTQVGSKVQNTWLTQGSTLAPDQT